MVRRIVIPAVAVALAAALLTVMPSIPSHAAARGQCDMLANIPRPISLSSTEAKLYAWGQLECASASSVAVEVCAVRFTPTGTMLDTKVVWCVHKLVQARSGTTLVRTPVHACAPGKAYRSTVRIVGRPWDHGPFKLCRSL
jgi:hypothetical protein